MILVVFFNSAYSQDCLPDSTGNYKYCVWLNQTEVSNQFKVNDLMGLINSSDKVSPNDLNMLQNTIQSAYKSFPTAQSEILKRTITVKSPNDDLESVIGKLTDIISFIEIVCYEEPFSLHDPFVPNDYSLTGANREKSHLELINATQAWGITTGDPSIYDIPENAPYIGLLGTGRLNAFAAVQEAVDCSKTIVINNQI